MTFRPLLAAISLMAVPTLASAAKFSPCAEGEAPKVRLNLVKHSGHIVYVCGTENLDIKPAKGFKNLSEMKVIALKLEEDPNVLLETTSLESYWVKKDEKKLLIDEVWWVDLDPVPALRREVTCTDRKCTLSKPICVLNGTPEEKAAKKGKGKGKKAPKKSQKKVARKKSSKKEKAEKKLDALQELRAILKDPASHPEADLQKLTAGVFSMALKGNKKAQAFFLNAKMPAELEGTPAADEWQADKAQLRRARQYRCIR